MAEEVGRAVGGGAPGVVLGLGGKVAGGVGGVGGGGGGHFGLCLAFGWSGFGFGWRCVV